MPNSNIELLASVAKKLGSLVEQVVFVGGCTTGLFVTDEAAAEIRPTYDVDVIAEIATYAGYAAFSERLRKLGFREDNSKGAPLCRWLIDAMTLDVMPSEANILGFTNRWYRDAMENAEETQLETNLRVRVVTAPYFVATKLEAFRGRGKSDYAGSHDLEDLLTVLDGRGAIVEEIAKAESIRGYIAEQFRALLDTPAFVDALPGHLLPDPASQARLPVLRQKIETVSKMKA
jgi:predicted nucleotidyltransferase